MASESKDGGHAKTFGVFDAKADGVVAADGSVTAAFLESARADFDADPKNRLARNSVTRVGVHAGLIDRDVSASLDHVFSVKVPTEGKATAQKSSGRCWLFAACNVMRNAMMEKYKLDSGFELSQTFLFFWDKVRRRACVFAFACTRGCADRCQHCRSRPDTSSARVMCATHPGPAAAPPPAGRSRSRTSSCSRSSTPRLRTSTAASCSTCCRRPLTMAASGT